MGKMRGARRMAARSAGGSGTFDVVQPGFYLATVNRAEEDTYVAPYKGQKGKFTYLKVTPNVELLNEVRTIINRHDITFGVIDDEGYLYRPDGDDSKSPLFSEAAFFLSALGFVDDDGFVDYEAYDPRLVSGQVVRVKVGNKQYQHRDGSTRVKNIIEGFYLVRDSDIEEHGFVVDDETGMVFYSEHDLERFRHMRDDIAYSVDGDIPF